MTKTLTAILVVLLFCIAITEGNVFAKFMKEHNKQYSSEAEQQMRSEIFKNNLLMIEEHNKGADFKLGITPFADMTLDEFVQTKLSSKSVHLPYLEELVRADPPASVDWRTHKNPVVVGPVRDNSVGTDAEVTAIVDSVASVFAVEGKDDVWTFDPQFVIDCDGQDSKSRNDKTVWAFIQKWGLPYYYDECPSEVFQGVCIQGHNCTRSGSETELAAAVATHGPVAINIDASHSSFQLYKSGIYYEPRCNSTLDHELLLVGYGTANGQDYWIARNSWGASWGQNGDIMIARNRNNNCGVATSACYAKSPKACMCKK